ncbi:MAG: hypothetical protein AW07_04511 [Candidatus Accumulibacter sp. SK-11]|nr:MAG: hypothetical protein AW07_04511 [Candidatus Accumulibacter sp. SK-11]
MAFALPRVTRQANEVARLGKGGGPPIDRCTGNGDLMRRRSDLLGTVVVARPADDHAAVRRARLEAVVEISAQDRMRSDLDEDRDSLVEQRVDGLGEEDWLANVAPPVAGAQLLAREQRSADRRAERQRRCARLDAGQCLPDSGLETVHRRAVESVVEIKPLPGRLPECCQCLLKRRQRWRAAGDRQAARAVDAGDRQLTGEPEFREQTLRRCLRQRDGGHLPLAPRRPL